MFQSFAKWMLALLLAPTLFVNSLGAQTNDRPNIIVIMADDLGYGDLSCYGATSLSLHRER